MEYLILQTDPHIQDNKYLTIKVQFQWITLVISLHLGELKSGLLSSPRAQILSLLELSMVSAEGVVTTTSWTQRIMSREPSNPVLVSSFFVVSYKGDKMSDSR